LAVVPSCSLIADFAMRFLIVHPPIVMGCASTCCDVIWKSSLVDECAHAERERTDAEKHEPRDVEIRDLGDARARWRAEHPLTMDHEEREGDADRDQDPAKDVGPHPPHAEPPR